MASTSQAGLDSQISDDLEKDTGDLFGIRDGVLFVIDATPPMFEEDPVEKIPYFVQCIRRYKEIVMQKLLWNSQDWMGLILFGTTKGDEDSDRENILTLQKLSLVSRNALNQVLRIDEGNEWKKYRDIASTTAYPLHDVLWYALRMYSSVKVTMPARRILLFTCQDEPPLTDDNEKRRIVGRANTCSDVGLQLTVVGLGQNWDHDIFYKDFEISSEQVNGEDYKRPCINDILHQIKLPSRTMAKLPWRIGGNVVLDVKLNNFNVKRQYLKKTWISKETNLPLTARRFRMVEESGDEDDEPKKLVHVLDMDLRKYRVRGGKRICFTLPEAQFLRNFFKPGIDLICAKPIFYHPLYHCASPYLVTPGKSDRKDNTLLFAALLEKCNSRNLMFVCAVTMRKHSPPFLYGMIPKSESGGFYLCKIPYKERVRTLKKFTMRYMYNNNKNKIRTKPHKVELLQKIIKKLRIRFHPSMISNPKLKRQFHMVETLALDLEESEPPDDETLPVINAVADRVKNLVIEFKDVFNYTGPPRKKTRTELQNTVYSVKTIRRRVKEGTLDCVTVPVLKGMLRSLGLTMSGRKHELIRRIQQHFKGNGTNSKKY